jgi:NADH-quinone oxidoreductase subunit M
VLAGLGILVGVAYTLRALQKAFFAEEEAVAFPALGLGDAHSHLEPITTPERIGAAILMATSLVIGLYPRLLLDLIVPSFSSPLFEGLRKAGGW